MRCVGLRVGIKEIYSVSAAEGNPGEHETLLLLGVSVIPPILSVGGSKLAWGIRPCTFRRGCPGKMLGRFRGWVKMLRRVGPLGRGMFPAGLWFGGLGDSLVF